MTRTALLATAIGIASFGCAVLTSLRAGHFDDAYITYVFAKNLAEHGGITWLPEGPPIYGSTTLPYTLLLGAVGAAGIDIASFSAWFGPAAWAVSYALLFLVLNRFAAPFAAMTASLVPRPELSSRLSLGMESGLFVALVLLTVLMAQSRHDRTSWLIAAAAALTRPEGILLMPVIAIHHWLRNRGIVAGDRLLQTLRPSVPAGVLMLAALIGIRLYFGRWIPQSIEAKTHFGCEVSGCFSLEALRTILSATFGQAGTAVILGAAVIGTGRILLSGNTAARSFAVWTLFYVTAFVLGKAPDSPWYYATVMPLVFSAAVLGIVELSDRLTVQRSERSRNVLLAALLVISAVHTTKIVYADPLGASVHINSEKEMLADAIRRDMTAESGEPPTVLAFEVGYLQYALQANVTDLLGLVTPGMQPCLRGEDPEGRLRTLQPDYVVIIDVPEYIATGCILKSSFLRTEFTPIFKLRRMSGHNYTVYRRGSALGTTTGNAGRPADRSTD